MPRKQNTRDWLHYAFVFLAIVLTFVSFMNVFDVLENDLFRNIGLAGAGIFLTLLMEFLIFYHADKLAHYYIVHEKNEINVSSTVALSLVIGGAAFVSLASGDFIPAAGSFIVFGTFVALLLSN